jgi:hypothetical protein
MVAVMKAQRKQGAAPSIQTCPMILFRRRRPESPRPLPLAPKGAWDRLAGIVNESIVLQDSSEVLLREIREEGSLREMAQRGGPMIRRFEALRGELPTSADPALSLYTQPLDRIFAHHAMVLSTALELLTVSWRSERMRAELRRIDGLGRPGQRLEALKAALDARVAGRE